jgi:predicted ATPase/DNA-binding winged helix-turn-helix (wHTH) protein
VSQLVLGGGTVDLQTGAVSTRVGALSLTELELKLLQYLYAHRDRVISRDELLERVWGYAPGVHSRTVDTTVQRLRAKVEAEPTQPAHLHTVRGSGWRLELPAEPAPQARPLGPIPRLEHLIGREAELRALRALLQRGATRITLTGPSGIGKTWLARRALTELCDTGRASTWFASLEGAATARDLLHVLADALGLPGGPDPAAAIVARLSEGPSTGVLDDLQALDDEALALLSGMLRRVPGLVVLVTSQRLLGLEGEHRLEIPPLEPAPSVALLRERLGALSLPLPSPEALEALAARAEGLPLAIELLCPLLEVLPVSRLLALPDLLALESDRPDLPRRHRSLRHAVQASLALLSPAELCVLSQLSVFAGPFPLQAAEAVVQVPSDVSLAATLSVLSRRSLLRRLPQQRLALDGPVRAQLRAQLDPAQLEPLRDRHARWLVALREEQTAVALIPWRLELQEALQHGPSHAVVPLAIALSVIVGRLGPVQAAPAVFARALERELPDTMRVQLIHMLAQAHGMASNLEACDRVAAEGLSLADRIGDESTAVRLLTERTSVASVEGRYEDAVRYGSEAVARAEALGDPRVLYGALEYLSTAHADARQPHLSMPLLERSVALARSLGDAMWLAISLMNLANTVPEGDPRWNTLLLEAQARVEGQQYPRLEGVIWGNLANRLSDAERFPEAEAAYLRAKELLEEAGDTALVWCFELRHAAEVAVQGRRLEGAQRMRQARDALRSLRPRDAARADVYLALLEGDPAPLREAAPVDELAAWALALMQGEPLPPGAGQRELHKLQGLLRRT